MNVAETAVLFDVEGQKDRRTTRGERASHDYLYFEPSLQLDLHGSVYHPNLLDFHFKPDLGTSWQKLRQFPPGGESTSVKVLQRYSARLEMLREKPYATSAYVERGRTYRDLDFFSRALVNSLRFGGHSGYVAGPMPFTVDAQHLAENVEGGLGRASDMVDNTLTFTAARTRKRGKTDLSYLLNTYHRTDEGMIPVTGTNHSLSLLDAATWGTDDRLSLNSTGLFNQLDSNVSRTRTVMAKEMLRVQLNPTLAGQCDYDFSDQRTNGVDTRSHDGRASLRHQLFKSLTSTGTLDAATLYTRGRGSRLGNDRAGLALEEAYTKQLPYGSRVTLSTNLRADRQWRKSTGQLLFVYGESLTLSDRQPAFLSQTRVASVQQVRSAAGIPYLETLDYVVTAHGDMMEIRRVPGGNIPDGARVLVDYTASVPPTDNYTTWTQFYQLRLDLFDGLIGLYGRVNVIKNHGGQSVVLRDVSDRAYGAEISWKFLDAGVERQTVDSNLSPYETTRIYQSVMFDVGVGATVSLDLEQGRTVFPDTGRTRTTRSIIARYRKQLGSFLTCELDGGVRRERGPGFDQDRVAARAALSYAYGNLTIDVSYDYEDENLVGELHRRSHFWVAAKRTF